MTSAAPIGIAGEAVIAAARDAAAAASPPARPFELRVLEGEQRGASVGVRPGVPLSVSASWHSDVVLRSAAAAQADVELLLQDGAIEVHVKQGTVFVAGVAVAAGQRARAPLYAPIVVGDTALAVGELGAAPWAGLFDAPAEAFAAAGTAQQAAVSQSAAATLGRRLSPRRLVIGGAVVAAVSLAVLVLAMLAAPAPPNAAQQAQRMQGLLNEAGFASLKVEAAGGEIVVGGHLDTPAQRAAAQSVLDRAGVRARMAPWLNDQVAAAVNDVYRVNGVSAEVKIAGPGVVAVSTRTSDTAALQRVEAIARRDVHGLKDLQANNEPPPRQPSPVPNVDDPGKRVVAIVGGERPYVVTADGSRHFVGALLPTGHRIQAIHAQSIQLEREGQVSTLSF
jgi:type III secretion protein D